MKQHLRTLLRDERGQVAHVEVLPFGLLIFVVAALMITNAWGVIDARLAASAAAREATRRYTEAPDAVTADGDARTAAASTVEGYGRDPARLRIDISADGFARCAPVSITATYDVPAVHLPWLGGLGDGFTVSSTHRELVDPYRSGLPGAAQC